MTYETTSYECFDYYTRCRLSTNVASRPKVLCTLYGPTYFTTLNYFIKSTSQLNAIPYNDIPRGRFDFNTVMF